MSINTRTRYIVYNHNGGGVRHHHFSVENDIIMEADGTASAPGNFPALGFPTLPFHETDVPFAFMSVHGAADGNHLYTSPGNQLVPVGTTDIDVLVVYAPPGGFGAGGGPGVWVDAFNVDTGNFSDSLDFIQVLSPPTPPDSLDAAKTTTGNMEGEISTASAENIRANSHVDGVPFLEWKRIVPTATISTNREIDLTQNESGEIWFAFYQSLPPPKAIGKIERLLEAGIFLWTGDDTCGNGGHWVGPGHGPGPGPGPVGKFRLSLKKEVVNSLKPEQRERLHTLMAEYPEIAGSALGGMTKVLGLLNEVNKLLAGAKTR